VSAPLPVAASFGGNGRDSLCSKLLIACQEHIVPYLAPLVSHRSCSSICPPVGDSPRHGHRQTYTRTSRAVIDVKRTDRAGRRSETGRASNHATNELPMRHVSITGPWQRREGASRRAGEEARRPDRGRTELVPHASLSSQLGRQ
jgi:hypothetical protein